MTGFLESVNFGRAGPVDHFVSVPRTYSHLSETITGSLHVSRTGHVYSGRSMPLAWIKFLGLAVGLPIYSVIKRCCEAVKGMFGKPRETKGFSDIPHACHLSSIAWRAVVGAGRQTLWERVEEFGLAEIDYNNRYRMLELDIPRASRFALGTYAAPCMQPLFHKTQFTAPTTLTNRIEQLRKELSQLQDVYNPRPIGMDFNGVRDLYGSFTNPFKNLPTNKVISEIESRQALISVLDQQQTRAQRCQRYAYQAIFNQQCCPSVKAEVVQTTEVECCNSVCYKHQKACGGLIHKVECLGLSCIALNCLCFSCCFLPSNMSCCVIA
jgi:hypothetical protein